jgi:hypothetical protein
MQLKDYHFSWFKCFNKNDGEEGMIYFIVSANGNIYDVKFLVGNISFERSLKKALLKSSCM